MEIFAETLLEKMLIILSVKTLKINHAYYQRYIVARKARDVAGQILSEPFTRTYPVR
ncbi:MAG: hypothetical protein HDQ99_10630 [Lachnospiraceae bacterium]|nr:hypothetical protein [Lachnospiraceae bacterium]